MLHLQYTSRTLRAWRRGTGGKRKTYQSVDESQSGSRTHGRVQQVRSFCTEVALKSCLDARACGSIQRGNRWLRVLGRPSMKETQINSFVQVRELEWSLA